MKWEVIFTWLGGVLTPSIEVLTYQALGIEGAPGFNFQIAVRKIARELCLGKIRENEFCECVLELVDTGLTPSSLEENLVSRATANHETVQLLDDLPSEYSLWLLSDFPRGWLKEIPIRATLKELFLDEQILIVPDLGLDRFIPDLFHMLEMESGKPLNECILIDPVSNRAIEATKRGLSGVIYVYPRHLEHEFTLRKMITTDADVLHPTESGRVTR
jgi:FMN phosphatase YigB (HAD superfamily)